MLDDPTVANNANATLYITLAIFGVLDGVVTVTTATATATATRFLPLFIAGALLGIVAGLLWAGERAIINPIVLHAVRASISVL